MVTIIVLLVADKFVDQCEIVVVRQVVMVEDMLFVNPFYCVPCRGGPHA